MDISLSHKKLGIPVESLDKVLRCCPNLVELRLRLGPEVNTLFKKPTTERRLRDAFKSLSTSLRAIQVVYISHPSRTKVLEELQALVCFANLDFLVLATKDGTIRAPPLDSAEWDTCDISGTYATWPIETNSAHLSSSLIKPETLRLNTDAVSFHPLLNIFGQDIKQIFYRRYSTRWDESLLDIIAKCQNIERILVLYTDRYVSGDSGTWVHTLRFCAVERQDWSISPVIREGESSGSSSNVNAIDSIELHSMSHIVGFHHAFPPSWKYKGHIQPRKRTIFDPRTAREAFFGTEIDLLRDPPTQFVRSTDFYDNVFVAFRKRGTNSEVSDSEGN
ncbi:17323_t:CDS:1 [Acaulospora colombiana]|uniref:17323_t:CDS:1 n=1 Tax=Acaulospora colombiana TaxID=27376 RepID=A0ACA9NDT0_9GLOM|nr:17323_t:CDS:1 [Acaulospora colombiana]